MQVVRRVGQTLVLFFIITAPLLYLYGVEKYAADTYGQSLARDQISDGRWLQQKAFALVDRLLADSDNQDAVIYSVVGSPWSINISGFNISDPLAALSISIAGRGFYWPILISIIPLALLTILLGRVFCGWLCPYHLIAEMNDKLRNLFVMLGLAPNNFQLGRGTKYTILAVLLALSLISGIPLFPHIYPPVVLSREMFGFMYYGTISFGSLFIMFLLLTELSLSRQWWCRYVCPGGAMYALLGSFRILRMTRSEEKCAPCGKCDEACPFGLLPMSDEIGMECDNCGLCKSVCPDDALSYKIIAPWANGENARARIKSSKSSATRMGASTNG
jgi:ferredoxin-type protein NapH